MRGYAYYDYWAKVAQRINREHPIGFLAHTAWAVAEALTKRSGTVECMRLAETNEHYQYIMRRFQ